MFNYIRNENGSSFLLVIILLFFIGFLLLEKMIGFFIGIIDDLLENILLISEVENFPDFRRSLPSWYFASFWFLGSRDRVVILSRKLADPGLGLSAL